MAPRKRTTSSVDAVTIESSSPSTSKEISHRVSPKTREPKLPSAIRLPLTILLSLSLNILLYGLATDFIRDLTAISRLDTDWPTALVVLGSKVGEIILAWVAGCDGYDVAALSVLAHTPFYYLLLTFYTITPTTVSLCMAADLLATSVPFYLLRGSSAFHQTHAPKGSIANRSVIEDLPIQIVTSVLGAGVYAVVILGAYHTFLRTWLIIHFNNLPSLEAAYDAQFFLLVLVFLPIGVASKVFLFTPAAGARKDATDGVSAQFDAVTATLGDTFWYNVWGYSKRVRILISRTLFIAAITGVSTAVRTYASIDGVELAGAIGWASTWIVASLLAGITFAWVTGSEVLVG